MEQEQRRTVIDRYKQGYGALEEALQGLTTDELDRRPSPSEWSPREVVHHLADSEMTAAIRLRRLLAEDHPTISGYDEMEFSRRLYYDRPIAASLEAVRAARLTSAELLERLTEEQWAREGTHTESGRYTVEHWLEIYTAHVYDHAAQLTRAVATGSKDAVAAADAR